MNADSRKGKVAAFFDLDGTLIPEPSLEKRFFTELRRARAIPLTNYLRWSLQALRLLPDGLLAVQQRNKRYLAGLSCDLVFRYQESIVFFEEGIDRVAWHAQCGHGIVLASGTIEALAQLAAMALECELEARNMSVRPKILATRLAEEHGRWTGYLAGEATYGQQKARAVERLAATEGFDLRECHAYGNSVQDGPLLCAVGRAHAVNPARDMAALANEKDWPIWHWVQEKRIASTEEPVAAAKISQIEEQA
jgi:HAD superfamily hydrolase (TIGR01490 family)